jgi:hypothetical protein
LAALAGRDPALRRLLAADQPPRLWQAEDRLEELPIYGSLAVAAAPCRVLSAGPMAARAFCLCRPVRRAEPLSAAALSRMGHRGRGCRADRLRAIGGGQTAGRRRAGNRKAQPVRLLWPIDRLQGFGLSDRRRRPAGEKRYLRFRVARSRRQPAKCQRSAAETVRDGDRELPSVQVPRKLFQRRRTAPRRRRRLVCGAVDLVGEFAAGDPGSVYGGTPGAVQQSRWDG